MITGTSANFTAQVEGVEQVAAWRVQLTLPAAAAAYDDVTLAVESMNVNASTTSDMPDQTRLQVGYPAMSCTFTLSGLVDVTDESKTAAWLFGPYSATSPLYKSDALYAAVTVDIGLYTDNGAGTTTQGTPEYARKFTGLVDDYTVNADGTVSFTCIEKMRQQLRGSVTLGSALTGVTSSSVPTATAEYLIDAALRADTAGAVSSWPAQRAQCQLAVGCRGSMLPELGSISDFGAVAFQPSMNGSGLVGTVTWLFATPSAALANSVPVYVHLDAFVTNISAGPTRDSFSLFTGTSGGSSFFLGLTTTNIRTSLGSGVVDTPISISAGNHTISLDLAVTGVAGNYHFTATVWIDGVSFAVPDTASGLSLGGQTFQRLQVNANVASIGGIQVTSEHLSTATNTTFVPQAVLDPSLNTLSVVNTTIGDTYQAIQQLVDAELGVAGGDESGRFRFYNRNTIRSAQSVRTVTSATSLLGVSGIETAAAAVVNHASVDWQGWDLGGTLSTIYSATTPVRIPRGQTITITVTLDGPAALLGSGSSLKLLGDGSGVIDNEVRFSTTKAGTAEFPFSNMGTTVRQISSNQLTFTFKNVGATDAWTVSPANYLDLPVGTPVLRAAGLAWTADSGGTLDYQYPPTSNGGAASTRFGDQVHNINGNQWIQDPDVATVLAQDIVVDLCNTRPNLTGVSIVPDPRLQLIDVVRIQDPDLTGLDEYARLFGWTINWAASGTFDMTIDARTLAAPGGWIMGYAGRSEIGSTAYVYASA